MNNVYYNITLKFLKSQKIEFENSFFNSMKEKLQHENSILQTNNRQFEIEKQN